MAYIYVNECIVGGGGIPGVEMMNSAPICVITAVNMNNRTLMHKQPK